MPIQTRASGEPDVIATRRNGVKYKIVLLLKNIQLLRAFLEENTGQGLNNLSYQSGQTILQQLWKLANNLEHHPAIDSVALINTFRQEFPPPISPKNTNLAADAAKQELDFILYEDPVANEFKQIFDSSLGSSVQDQSIEGAKHRYLIEFHRRLQQLIREEQRGLQIGEGGIIEISPNNNNRIALIMAAITMENEISENLPRTSRTASYLDSLAQPDENRDNLKQAFEIQDDAARGTVLTSATPYAEETSLFQLRIDNALFKPNAVRPLEELPAIFVNVFKQRIQTLGREIYRLRFKAEPTPDERSRIEFLQRTKFHLTILLGDEMQNCHICKELKAISSLQGRYSGHQAVFEAKKIAVALFVKAFANKAPTLDSNDKVITYSQVLSNVEISNEAKSYLMRAGALVYSMITSKAQQGQYVRMTPEIFGAFISDSALTGYVTRLSETPPTNYSGIDAFKRSGDSHSRTEYYDQFVRYKESSLGFDARTIAYSALMGCGLTDYEISQMNPKKMFTALFR